MKKLPPKIIISPPEIRAARQADADREALAFDANRLTYNRTKRCIMLTLQNNAMVVIPVRNIPALANATSAELAALHLSDSGGAISQRELDLDISVPGLIRRMLGLHEVQQARAGRAKTKVKAAAARVNGSKGGRPRKPLVEA